jgi:hypothetical protein
MPSIAKRWWFWCTAIIVIASVSGSVVLFLIPRPTTISQEDFDNLQEGMNKRDIEEILGKGTAEFSQSRDELTFELLSWTDGPSFIAVTLIDGKMTAKSIHVATVKERIRWVLTERLKKLRPGKRTRVDQRACP